MTETIISLNLGFRPEAAVSGALLLQSETATFLVFNAMKPEGDKYTDAGLAVIEFECCSITQFGYPNDEAQMGIPRLKELSYGCYEVINSEWTTELARLNRYAFPDTQAWQQRHFLFLFHDSSFECVASDLRATLSNEPIVDVLARLTARIAAE